MSSSTNLSPLPPPTPSLQVNLKNFSINPINNKKEKNNFWKMIPNKLNKTSSSTSPIYTISPAGQSIGTFDLQLKKPEPTIFVYSQRRSRAKRIWIRRGLFAGASIFLFCLILICIIWVIQQQQNNKEIPLKTTTESTIN
ncbi:unnamed protein product [Meloidogyne enterolobii]|uniref:Uncharacterized protein n=1 Tax=Meloidogyne enterolobii TaxID=390850 RepID=A0ACB0YRP4_MELEN